MTDNGKWLLLPVPDRDSNPFRAAIPPAQNTIKKDFNNQARFFLKPIKNRSLTNTRYSKMGKRR
ncbi:hypothetical protein DDZ16_18030 [Marinilabilia rubra]|uniref:Uncharacterized protein n=1 Tax=Marinilabilia rubra TaxID=2162893 RepID=A0A2U2B4H0_9BACT|nr:hypothetical protein DDZ16_18030 [Marinilabilia rubra]